MSATQPNNHRTPPAEDNLLAALQHQPLQTALQASPPTTARATRRKRAYAFRVIPGFGARSELFDSTKVRCGDDNPGIQLEQGGRV
jgi:hypothetical protein